MPGDPYGFDPDWVTAPAATLDDFMRERCHTVASLAAAAVVDYRQRDEAAALIQEVLDRKPLDLNHATILAAATGAPAGFWLRRERIYREGLAAGKKDVTHAIPREVTDAD